MNNMNNNKCIWGRRGGPNIFGGGEGGHAKIIEGGEGESRPNY